MRKIERIRLAPGDYFGEVVLLTGEPVNGEIIALTRVVIYEISKDALSPLLKGRPSIAEELSESLASRQLARRTVLDHHHHEEQHVEGWRAGSQYQASILTSLITAIHY